jgi:hypothetical protein
MSRKQITQGNETLLPDWQKESWQTFEETSGHVRPERINKWPNSMTDMMMVMIMMMMMMPRYIYCKPMKMECWENNKRYTFQVVNFGTLIEKLSSKATVMMQYIYHV